MNSNLGGKIVTVLIVIGAVVLGYLRVSNREAVRKFEANTAQLQAKANDIMRRQLAGEEVGDEAVKLFDEFLAEAQRAGDEVGGKDAKALKAIVLSMRDLQKPLKEYNDAFAAVMKLGGAAPEGIKTVQDIDTRIALFDRMHQANEALDQHFKKLPDTLRTNLKSEGMSDGDLTQAVAKLSSSAKLDMVAKVRQTDRDLIAAMKAQFLVLKREFGDWHLDKDNGIIFKNDPAIDEFNRHFDKMQAAANEQERLQREAMLKR